MAQEQKSLTFDEQREPQVKRFKKKGPKKVPHYSLNSGNKGNLSMTPPIEKIMLKPYLNLGLDLR